MWKKGQSGNPAGRKKGVRVTKNIMKNALDAYSKTNNINAQQSIMDKLISQSIEGDNFSTKLILSRIEPEFKPIARTVQITGLATDTLGRLEGLFELSTSGDITPEEATSFLKLLDSLGNYKEIKALSDKLESFVANDKALN